MAWRFHQFARGLHQLAAAFLNALLSPDYADHRYLHERRHHDAKQLIAQALWAMRTDAALPVALSVEAAMLEAIQLRFRVQDWALFQVCEIELQGLKAVLCACFDKLSESACDEGHLQWLDAQITQFESITETVLSVSAPDPQPFTLFIFALQSLRAALSATEGVL